MRSRRNIHVWSFSLLLIVLTFDLQAQTRLELERERTELIQDIQETTTELNQTKKDRKTTFKAYSTLSNQVQNRQLLINNLKRELDFQERSITGITQKLDTIQADLTRLEKDYGELLRNAYRMRLNNSWFLFLLSSNGINDSFKRWRYIKQMEAHRKRHMHLLLETSTELEINKQELEREKTEKIHLLETVEEQNQLLYSELDRKSALLKTLSTSEKELVVELNRQKAEKEKLSRAIESIIETAITGTSRRPSVPTAPEYGTNVLYGESKVFFTNKGRLPWPVKNAVVTKHFGKQVHSTVKTIQITNNGIDLKAASDLSVSTVFDGTVVGVQFIPGFNNTIILKHGIFYTVYSNLEEVFIERGDDVSKNQPIGRLKKGNPELHFEIWQEKTRLNPINWLIRQS